MLSASSQDFIPILPHKFKPKRVARANGVIDVKYLPPLYETYLPQKKREKKAVNID